MAKKTVQMSDAEYKLWQEAKVDITKKAETETNKGKLVGLWVECQALFTSIIAVEKAYTPPWKATKSDTTPKPLEKDSVRAKVLAHIATGEKSSAMSVAKALDKVSVANVLASLVEWKWIAKIREGQRNVFFSITPAGKTALAALNSPANSTLVPPTQAAK